MHPHTQFSLFLRAIAQVVVALAFLYLCMLLVMSAFVERFVYPFGQEAFAHPGFIQRFVPVPGADPIEIALSIGPPDADGGPAPVVFYFQGNYGSRTGFLPTLLAHQAAGFTVVSMTYRGAEGVLPDATVSTEDALLRDALAVFDAIPTLVEHPISGVHLHGYSMGSALAARVAAQRNALSLTMESGFASLCSAINDAIVLPIACLLPWVPVWDIVERSVTAGIQEPVLLAIAMDDTVISPSQTERLAAAWQATGVDIDVQRYAGAGHFDLPSTDFPQRTISFVRRSDPRSMAPHVPNDLSLSPP